MRRRYLIPLSLVAVLAVWGCDVSAPSPGADDVAGPLLLFAQGGGAAEVIIRPSEMQGWAFLQESGASGTASGSLAVGPASPPRGGGSARFQLSTSAAGMALGTLGFVGVRLDQITKLEYCTYVAHAPGSQAVALQLNFDNNVTDNDTGFKGRLVFEPANTPGSIVMKHQWQCWNALLGRWWATRVPAMQFFPIGNPRPLSDILAKFPNAGFNSSFGGILLKAGSGWSSFDGNADALVIGINDVETTYNFESEPSSREDCFNGGWRDFGFSNQGMCVNYVAHHDGRGRDDERARPGN